MTTSQQQINLTTSYSKSSKHIHMHKHLHMNTHSLSVHVSNCEVWQINEKVSDAEDY